ncbi:malonate decarboxylase holo-ACP synthase [Prodigiosinella aquatilis]|nr:malonate decarboxylase holo-ACP synthase [Prodigiosinella sp. LS101]WJV51963.1 malonate decarboxylase holo-ACP synthase [Prodigiosinella sp. LS101]WJV56319.1 malonate decarboxylase holo-ACP synthase [Pectobacteriaceae bacterium C111]
MIRPHDLIWVADLAALGTEQELPEWVSQQWHIGLPLVVRRDKHHAGRIPAGIRGTQRSQRAAVWVDAAAVHRITTPESLVTDAFVLLRSPFISLPPVQALMSLLRLLRNWHWGVTGSCGYALATGLPVMHDNSDLDIVVRCPQPVERTTLIELTRCLQLIPCRMDVQIETPQGGFALLEWLRSDRVLIKTNAGPRLSVSPWDTDEMTL